MYKKIFFYTIFVLIFKQTFTQNIQTGLPFIKNFTTKEYNAHTQNFGQTEDARGILYFANFAGVLEYDGKKWKLIETKNGYRVTSIQADTTGVVYVGGLGEFGFLIPDETGLLSFKSLINNQFADSLTITKILNLFTDLHNKTEILLLETNNILINSANENFFVSSKGIAKFDGQKLTLLYESDNKILSSFIINNQIYIFEQKDGIKYFKNNKFNAIENNEKIEQLFSLDFMLELNSDSILIGSGQSGVFILTNNKIFDIDFEAEKYFYENEISSGIKISDNLYAIGTIRGGILIMNLLGETIQIIDKNSGLNNQSVSNLYLSKSGNLWATLYNGISMIEANSPISIYNEKNGLNGDVIDIDNFNNKIYIATTEGLFYLENNIFVKEISIKSSCNDLFVTQNEMYIATSNGVYKLQNNNYSKITNDLTISIYKSDDKLIAGLTDGLFEISQNKINIANIENEIWKIIQDDQNNYWFQTSTNGILKYQEENNLLVVYDTTRGVPTLYSNQLNLFNNQIYITSEKGIFKYSQENNKFENTNIFNSKIILPNFLTTIIGKEKIDKLLTQNFWISQIEKDKNNNIWTNLGDETGINLYINKDGSYINSSEPFLPISDFKVKKIFCDSTTGTTWFGGTEGLIRYNSDITKNYKIDYNTLLRKVYLKNDSILFNGTFYDNNLINNNLQNDIFKYDLDFSLNTISFEFVAATYNINDNIKYQFMLEGFDQNWSEWSSENLKEYTNLPEGSYIFKVKSKNIYEQIGSTAIFEFEILTPLYRRWWAISIYIILGTLLVYSVVMWRLRSLRKEKELLEEIVKERTEEIENQKEELKTQSDELANKNDELSRIDEIVQAINSEITLDSLLKSFLEKLKLMTRLDKAVAIILDRDENIFKFKAGIGLDFLTIQNVKLNLEQTKVRYLKNSTEIFDGIFVNNLVKPKQYGDELDKLEQPKSILSIVVEINNNIEGFLILWSTKYYDAFGNADFSLLKNLREHINSTFIKAQILEDLQKTLTNLKDTQDELIRKEKLASVGQLTKGIVDRLINPMNYINNFSQISKDLSIEIKEIIAADKSISKETIEDSEDILGMLNSNLDKINNHGVSATRIVKGMEKLLKEKSNIFKEVKLDNIIESSFNRALADYKIENKTFNVELITTYDSRIESLNLLQNEFSDALYYIFNNSFYAINLKLNEDKTLKSKIAITTKVSDNQLILSIKDNGIGIVEKELIHIFEPFFTTKPTSQGTGLGLYMAQDIIKLHKGYIKISSNHKEFTEILINLPITKN